VRRTARSLRIRRPAPDGPLLALGFLVSGVLLGLPAAGWAQEGCQFVPPTRSFRQVQVGGSFNRYVGQPHLLCADGVEMWADSAVEYSQLGMSLFMGSVRYRDRTQELRADTARYLSRQERLQAHGSLFVRNEEDGSQIENGVLVYLRQTDFRDEESMTVTVGEDGVRPRALLRAGQPDAGDGAAPYTVVGDRIDLRGDSYFSATGDVDITRDSLFAHADTAEFDQARDELILVGAARVVSRGTELTGGTVTLTAPGADTSRIRATREALLLAEGVRLESPGITVFLVDDAAERLVATALPPDTMSAGAADSASAAQPVATLESAILRGDSIEIRAPAEVVEQVVAVGRARSESSARDSLNVQSLPEVARTDWLEGDTVVVTFRDAPGGPPESGGAGRKREIDSVTARGGAKALYRLEPTDSLSRAGVDPPALHYVLGSSITITMGTEGGGVSDIHVQGQTRGVHLEPLARRMVADTLASDTVATDTLAAPKPGPRPPGPSARPSGLGPAPDPGPAGRGGGSRTHPLFPAGSRRPWRSD